ncbi:helix-turn-helix domain-containing protein [Streptomyces sp. NPDC017615]|uniref:helix-turn-helix domain-containing protein n=1 Tax=Streptomyces sp. NPDC017615 TaxID=3365003 RepID=UPI0037945954
MATTHPTTPLDLATRRAAVRQLADIERLSHRAIARRLGIHHNTVARDLAATAEPQAEPKRAALAAVAPVDTPPPATSPKAPEPTLLRPLAPDLIQDLNILTDPHTGELPEPLRRYIRATANAARADWLAALQRQQPASA